MSRPAQPAQASILGRTIAYSAGGAGERTVVFLHGFGADRSTWMFNLPAVGEVARFVAPDLPGHGASDVDVGSGDLIFHTDIVRGLLDRLSIDRAHFVAHSLGGAIALELATVDPARVAGLSLVAPAGFSDTINRSFIDSFVGMSDPEATRATLGLLVARPEMISAWMVNETLAFVARPGVADALRTIAARVFPDGRQRHRFDHRIATLGLPVDIVWGAKDRVLPPWRSPLRHLSARLVDAGHLAQMERPQEVNRILLDALCGEAPS